jgi:hypothetical protein
MRRQVALPVHNLDEVGAERISTAPTTGTARWWLDLSNEKSDLAAGTGDIGWADSGRRNRNLEPAVTAGEVATQSRVDVNTVGLHRQLEWMRDDLRRWI